MKTLILFLGVVFGVTAFAQDYCPVKIKYIPDVTFAPMGFDSNDNAQVVLAGEFPNTCYHVGMTKAKVDKQNKKVVIQDEAYLYDSSWCTFMKIPYTQVINLGVLPPGKYEVSIQNKLGGNIKMADLPIMETKSVEPDDFLYAPVKDAIFSHDSATKVDTLTLRGSFTNSCMSIDNVRLNYRSNNVIEVLPIAKMETQGCADVMVPYEHKITLTQKLRGKALFHVRALSGQAINNVVDFDDFEQP